VAALPGIRDLTTRTEQNVSRAGMLAHVKNFFSGE
jgi:hypothetical protein